LSGAVVDGLLAARGEWVCVMDADLQHPPEIIPRLWDVARRSGADLVVGSRRGDVVGPLGLSRTRSLTSKLLTILARMLFPRVLRNVSDPLTGLFLVRRDRVDPQLLQPEGFKILLELLVRCPALQVAEISFDFAPRYTGESKADVREGLRFFRHLLRLRFTANAHLLRFLIAVLTGLIGNAIVLWLLVEKVGWSIGPATFAAAQFPTLSNYFLFERWVYSERQQKVFTWQFWGYLAFSQLLILIVQLPLMFVLLRWAGIPYLVANLCGMLAISLLRYGLSEQWIWTSSGMTWQLPVYRYDLHGILLLESQVALSDLQAFQLPQMDPGGEPAGQYVGRDADVQIRVDRQGTPSRIAGGISYDEHLGRFGFGLSVVTGELTQIVVSPLLARSPAFLFTNVIEPVLRWALVTKGYAFVRGASVAREGTAIILHSSDDMGPAIVELSRVHGYGYMGDDLAILDRTGRVLSYPKPVTIDPLMMSIPPAPGSGERGDRPSFILPWQGRLALFGRRMLYTRALRSFGLWLSKRELPAATLNTYLQSFVPQPKLMLERIVDDVTRADSATAAMVVAISQDPTTTRPPNLEEFAALLRMDDREDGFQPQPLLARSLRLWQGVDLEPQELSIILGALRACRLLRLAHPDGGRWADLIRGISTRSGSPNSGQAEDTRLLNDLDKTRGRAGHLYGEPGAS
jgi:putative flippase GtrA